MAWLGLAPYSGEDLALEERKQLEPRADSGALRSFFFCRSVLLEAACPSPSAASSHRGSIPAPVVTGMAVFHLGMRTGRTRTDELGRGVTTLILAPFRGSCVLAASRPLLSTFSVLSQGSEFLITSVCYFHTALVTVLCAERHATSSSIAVWRSVPRRRADVSIAADTPDTRSHARSLLAPSLCGALWCSGWLSLALAGSGWPLRVCGRQE